jgi:hypothetical protein
MLLLNLFNSCPKMGGIGNPATSFSTSRFLKNPLSELSILKHFHDAGRVFMTTYVLVDSTAPSKTLLVLNVLKCYSHLITVRRATSNVKMAEESNERSWMSSSWTAKHSVCVYTHQFWTHLPEDLFFEIRNLLLIQRK